MSSKDIKKKSNPIFLKIIIGVVIAAILYFVLLTIETGILKGYEKKKTVITSQEILTGTTIDETNVNKYFTEYEADAKLVPDNAVTNKNSLIGTVIRSDMYANQIVSKNDYENKNDILSKLNNPTEVTISASSLSNAVAGRLRGGSYVDISVLDSTTRECSYALQNVYLNKAMTSDGTEVARDDSKSVATVFNIIVSQSDVNTLLEKVNSGTVVLTYPGVKVNIDEVVMDKPAEASETVTE